MLLLWGVGGVFVKPKLDAVHEGELEVIHGSLWARLVAGTFSLVGCFGRRTWVKELFNCVGRVVERFSPGKVVEGVMVDVAEGVGVFDDPEADVFARPRTPIVNDNHLRGVDGSQ